jgi:hypothetical protein
VSASPTQGRVNAAEARREVGFQSQDQDASTRLNWITRTHLPMAGYAMLMATAVTLPTISASFG